MSMRMKSYRLLAVLLVASLAFLQQVSLEAGSSRSSSSISKSAKSKSARSKSSSKRSRSLKKHISDLRVQMATQVPDIERVDAMLVPYKKLISKLSLSNQTRKSIAAWMCRNNIFLGSKYYDHNRLYKAVPHLSRNATFRKAYKTFVSQISVPAKNYKASNDDARIAILFTGCYGGGHKAPATAISTYFEKQGYQVKLIDVDEVADRYSPVVEGYTRAQIYQEVYQKEGNIKKAHRLREKMKDLQTIESNRYIKDLKDMLVDFRATHIFTVAHHRPELGYLSYQLGLPMLFVHTDYIFHKKLVPILKEQERLKNPLIKFTVLANNRSFFKNAEKMLDIKMQKFSPQIKRQLVKCGFPVRQSFAPVKASEMHHLRRALNIPVDAVVCKLAMGQNALVQEIQTVLQRLKKEKIQAHQEVHVFVICGKNDHLKAHLEEQLAADSMNNRKANLHIHVMGFLNEQNMAKIDQASDVWISKPGGSTCGELLRTQKQLLYVLNSNHPWEASNAEYLERLHLASELSENRPIVNQMYKRIREHEKIDLDDLPTGEWQLKAREFVEGR